MLHVWAIQSYPNFYLLILTFSVFSPNVCILHWKSALLNLLYTPLALSRRMSTSKNVVTRFENMYYCKIK